MEWKRQYRQNYFLKYEDMKKTKIIATIWPSTQSEEKILQMYESWINIIRFNFSHADYENSEKIANNIHKLNDLWQTNLSLLLDTKWPKIRTWNLKNKLNLKVWDKLKIFINDNKKDENSIFCDYPYIIEDLKIWDNIVIDSWLCNVKVIWKNNDFLETEVLNNCEIWNKRHINLPWIKLKLPWITQKDEEDIIFGVKNNFDFIALSFVRDKEGILKRKEILKNNNASHIKIISKIENEESIQNLEEIINFSDGIMIARWDLWIEVPIEKLPFYQREIADICLKKWKFFIIATHLLETMIENPFPTRAEVSDIYNSVLMNCDSTMLSWETATWKFPIESIQIMTKIIKEAEKIKQNINIDFSNEWLNNRDIDKKVMIKYSFQIAKDLWIKNIVILTKTWLLARIASSFRSDINIYAFTNLTNSIKYMNILYNVRPMLIKDWSENHIENAKKWVHILKEQKILNPKEKIIIITDLQNSSKEIPIIEILEI